eukprot:1157940-Pelagomonas_calceolata.AAC.4
MQHCNHHKCGQKPSLGLVGPAGLGPCLHRHRSLFTQVRADGAGHKKSSDSQSATAIWPAPGPLGFSLSRRALLGRFTFMAEVFSEDLADIVAFLSIMDR